MAKRRKQTIFSNRLRSMKFDWRIVLVVAILAAAGGYLFFRLSRAGAPAKQFIDISSPQCNALDGKSKQYFGIVGLNGTYMNFGNNPCVQREVALFTIYDLYVGANYPSSKCTGLSPYDCGARAGQFNLDLIRLLSLKPITLWIDVENGKGIPWSTPQNNWQFLSGMYDRMRTKYPVGFYSNQSMWQQITGGIDLSQKYPGQLMNWYATGRTSPEQAKLYCGTRFGNVPNIYVQWVLNGSVDVNESCI